MTNGWVKLHRKILESDIWFDVTATRLFIFLILNCNHSKERHYGEITVGRGQWLASYRRLQEDLEYREGKKKKRYSMKKIRKAIDTLKNSGCIEIISTNLGTLFTITKYNLYQSNSDEISEKISAEQGTPQTIKTNNVDKVFNDVELFSGHANGHTNGYNNKNDKNDKNIIYTVPNEKNHFLKDSSQIKLSELLYQKIIEYRKIPKPNFSNWAKWIEKIHTELEKSFEEIEHAILYSQQESNRADKYFPVIQSAQALFEKYNKLINYKERKNKNGNFKPDLSREGFVDTLRQVERIQSEPSWLFN